jgi:hypothetical protein
MAKQMRQLLKKMRFAKTNSGLLALLLALGAFGAGFIAYVILDRAFFVKKKVPAAYEYPIEQLAVIDPGLIVCRQVGSPIETGLQRASAVDVDAQGILYAAGDEKILVFSSSGRKEKEIILPAMPTALKTAEGLLYTALTERIELYSPQGEQLAVWANIPGALLTSIAVGREDVFTADALHKVVRRFDKQGNPLGLIGQKDAERGIEGFVVPSPYFDILIAPDGLLRVVNPGRQRVEAYTFDGHLEWHWGSPSMGIEGFCGCCNPVALAMLPDGAFVTAEKGLVRVKLYDDEGNLLGVVAGPRQLGWQAPIRVCEGPQDCQVRGLDVAADPQGRIYVLEQVRNTILVFEKIQ